LQGCRLHQLEALARARLRQILFEIVPRFVDSPGWQAADRFLTRPCAARGLIPRRIDVERRPESTPDGALGLQGLPPDDAIVLAPELNEAA
jgi:hypothetical protein